MNTILQHINVQSCAILGCLVEDNTYDLIYNI